jgi:hypothetical protein
MDYEQQLNSYLTKQCHFIGIYKLEDIYAFTDRIRAGGDMTSSTTVFEVNSPHITQPYYALLYRSSSRDIEWFDPLGMSPPQILVNWCTDYGFIYPEICTEPVLSPDKITWSGEFCAYFMKHRLQSVNLHQTRWRFFESRVPASIIRVRRVVDFSPKWGPPFPN